MNFSKRCWGHFCPPAEKVITSDACNMVISYLEDRCQRVKVMGEFSYCTTINRGVPQGSVMGPLLFHIFLNDLFYVDMNCDIANYADDDNLYYAKSYAITLKMFLKMTLDQPLHGLKIITRMPTLTNSKAMMTSSNGNIFRVTGHLCGEFTGHRWIPHTKASDAEFDVFFIRVWINGWVNNREAGNLRRYGGPLWRHRNDDPEQRGRCTNLSPCAG